MISYVHGTIYEWAVFPFHETCFEILAKAITAFPRSESLDKDVLYDTMCDSDGNCSILGLDYGAVSGADQDWQCVPGEEASPCCCSLNSLDGYLIKLTSFS